MFIQVPDQLLHSDVPFDDKSMESKHMFIGILALQRGTAIRVCPGSHQTGVFEEVKFVELDKYEYIVCHPKLIHGGCGADEDNWRLHFYHGIPRRIALMTSFPTIIQKPREEIRGDICTIAREAKKKSTNAIVEAREAKKKSKNADAEAREAKKKSKNALAVATEAKKKSKNAIAKATEAKKKSKNAIAKARTATTCI